MKKRVIDKRVKEKFMMDDAYLNGMAKKCGWQATLVYLCLCRHADKDQESFPSIKFMQDKLGVSRKVVIKGIKSLEENNVIEVKREKKKNGDYQNNIYTLIDKSEWKGYLVPNGYHPPSTPQALPSTPGEPPLVPHGDTKETHNKETHIRDITEIRISDGDFIEMFKDVNPNHTILFRRKNQREAIRRMVLAHGEEKVRSIIAFLPRNNATPYAPTITTPLQLEEKMGTLFSYWQKAKQKSDDKKFKVISY